MKITIVAQRFPYPLDRGDRLTIYHLIKHLSVRHEVSLVTFTEPYHEPAWNAELEPYCVKMETIPMRKWRCYANCITGVFSKLPLQVHYNFDPAMKVLVDQVIEETQPDLLYAHYIRMGQYVESHNKIPRVLAMQLSMTLNYERLAKNATTWVHKALYNIEHKKLLKFEADFARKFDQVMLISPRDLEAVAAQPPLTNVFFNPHGVDFDFFAPDPTVEKEANSLVFSGNMKYMPNIDAAVYFCAEILPLIRKHVPTVKVYILGTRPTAEVMELAKDPAIIVTGRVPDLREYMNRAEVAIVPMRIVAGLLNKVLEGLAMALPIVATPQANEGIKALDGTHIMIADTPEKFAMEVVQLLNDPARREQLGSAGREFIRQKWSWEAHLIELEQSFVDLAENSN